MFEQEQENGLSEAKADLDLRYHSGCDLQFQIFNSNTIKMKNMPRYLELFPFFFCPAQK